MLFFIWLYIHSCVHVGAAVGGTVWSCMGEVGGAVGQPPPLHVGRQSVFMSAVTLYPLLTPPNVPHHLSWYTWSVCSSREQQVV